jgi:hypothetical protein
MSLDDITKLRKQQLRSDASGKAPKKAPGKKVARAEPYVASGKICRNCMKPGHLQAQCPLARACLVCGKADHAKADCPKVNESCRNCGQVGHLASRCLKAAVAKNVPVTNGSEAQPLLGVDADSPQHCFVCGSTAHLKAECPHSNKVCDICKKVGHLKATCRSTQMQPGVRAAVVAAVGRPVFPSPASATSVPKACYVCGSVAHERKNCPHKAQVCEACGKTGHFTALCPMKKQ